MGELNARWSALVTARRAEWRAGMLVLWQEDDEAPWPERLDDGDSRAEHPAKGDPRPVGLDWTDPATLGCLLGLVRERWGQGDMAAMYWTMEGPKRWCIEFTGRDDFEGPPGVEYDGAWYGPTEAEALIAALEAAPEGA